MRSTAARGTDYVGGKQVSQADLYLMPVLTYLQATPESRALLSGTPDIEAWKRRMKQRSRVRTVMPEA